MKKLLKSVLPLTLTAAIIIPHGVSAHDGRYNRVEVSITNISNVVFTPPIVALCGRKMEPIATVGESASDALEPLAEGGDTSALAAIFDANGCYYTASTQPVLPGQTITLEVQGSRRGYLNMASMLLPTNDGFIFASNKHVRHIKRQGKIMLKSYDAGTEFNDEVCANIPGPQCGGDGFNEARETNDFVKPHPGIQGVADVSSALYNWGEPVAYISVK